MPAIELGRLQQQVNQLSDRFLDSTSYVQGVRTLLEAHAGPVHRQGRVKGIRPILRSFEVPPPLLKILIQEMGIQARAHPQESLAVVDGLWELETLETRQLAIHLLGHTPTKTAIDITSRLEKWARENHEPLLAPEMASSGSKTLRSNHQEMLLIFTSKLLNSRNSRKQMLGLGVLQNLISQNHFPDLPGLFQVLLPVCKTADRRIRPELADLLMTLAGKSPKETEFFLQQLINEAIQSDTVRWLTQKTLKSLPKESQVRLQLALSKTAY